jgi:lipopolysaccharide export LptBFGC system permease protein LptF
LFKPTTLQRYVLKETLIVALMALVALTGMIFIGLAVELVNKGLSIVQLRDIIPFVFARSLPYALPTSALVSTVFVFGRLSGKNELTAMRASGINLNHVIRPLLYIALCASLFTVFLNHYLLPWSHNEVKQLAETIAKKAIRHVGTSYTRFAIDRYMIYIGGMTPDNRFWKDVALIEFADDYPAQILLAERGHCQVDDEKNIATIRLFETTIFQPRLGDMDDTPITNVEELTLNLDLNADRKEMPPGFQAKDIDAIKAVVNRAITYVDHPVGKIAGNDTLIFFHGTGAITADTRVAFIRFDDTQRPTALLLAESAERLPKGDMPSGDWTLRKGTAYKITKDGVGSGERFETRHFITSQDTTPRVPEVGTKPEKLWFRIRPKYLTLPELQQARRALAARMAELRKNPEFAEVKHPRSQRRALGKKADKLYRKYVNEDAKASPLRRTLSKGVSALTALEKQHDVLTRKGESLTSEVDDAEAGIKKDQRALADMDEAIEALKKRDPVPEERLASRAKAREAQADKIAASKEALTALRKDEKALVAQANKLAQTMADQSKENGETQAKLDAQNAVVAKAKAEVDTMKHKERQLRQMERYFVAESQFHFRNAGALTALVFIIIGIPLGILSRHGNVLMAFAVSFCAVLAIYYPLMITAQMVGRDGFMTPWMAQWMPNAAVGIIGLVLITRVIRR